MGIFLFEAWSACRLALRRGAWVQGLGPGVSTPLSIYIYMYIHIFQSISYTDMFACTLTSLYEDTDLHMHIHTLKHTHIYVYIYICIMYGLTRNTKRCRLGTFQIFLKVFAGWDPGRHAQKDRLQNHLPEFGFEFSVWAAVRHLK